MSDTISADWLKEIGVVAAAAELESLATHAEGALELLVGYQITRQLTGSQIDEFQSLLSSGATEDERLAWLEAVYPAYQDIVAEETLKLRLAISLQDDKAKYIRQLKS